MVLRRILRRLIHYKDYFSIQSGKDWILVYISPKRKEVAFRILENWADYTNVVYAAAWQNLHNMCYSDTDVSRIGRLKRDECEL